MHDYLEKFLLGKLNMDLLGDNTREKMMADQIIENGLRDKLSEIWGCEATLYYPGKYAGAADCIGIYENKETIIDFKQSNKPKKDEWIDDYYLQCAAYSLAHNKVHGSNITQAAILLCTKDNIFQRFIVEGERLINYQNQFMEKVEQFYSQRMVKLNYVVWDIETDSAQLDWATMIEVGAILLDENFNEKERFTARCRMPQDRVPSATALCINKSNVDLITKGNLSHYQMIAQVEKKFREWSPATFMGFSSIGFDDEILRREFFKSLRKPYLINTEGNSRHDALNMIKAAFAIDENVLKTELNHKGNKSMKLESLARLNGFDSQELMELF